MAMMTRAEALDYINHNPEGAGWRRDKSGKGYVCPLCGNGSGSEGDGLRLNPKSKSNHPHYKCFRCNASGDVMEFIAQEYGLQAGSAEAFSKAYEIYGLTVQNDSGYSSGGNEPIAWDGYISEDEAKEVEGVEPVKTETTAAPAAQAEAEAQAAARDYVRECIAAASGGADYIKGRGISSKTAAAAGIGYDERRQAIVIPTRSEDGYSYVLRHTNPAMKIRYQNAEGLSVGLFNLKALKSKEPVTILEGGFDALSLLEVGYQAIGLCSTSNAGKLIEMLERAKRDGKSLPPRFIVSMDNDKAGEDAAETLSEGLQRLSIPFEVADVSGGYKDANEALQADRERFKCAVYKAVYRAEAEAVEAHKAGALLPAFRAYVMDGKSNRAIPTGFRALDKAIGGGLFPRLYVLGAISSLGKTTFALQIADRLAASGHSVMIFSLEMPAEDLIARSLSRLSYQIAKSRNSLRLAKTELGITALERYEHYTDDERETIKTAYNQYEAYAQDTVSIYTGRQTANEIRAKVEAFIKATGRKPVVFIDYLQLIRPAEELRRATSIEQLDDTVDKLAALRRELKLPVVVISSFNRANYNTVADATAFRGSGLIEYTADAVITLELDVERKASATGAAVSNAAKLSTMDGMRGNLDSVREIKLTFLKNRGNKVGSQIYYTYDARFNYFEEDDSKVHIL